MANLFVIGNGFDRAHGLPTSYENFRRFLKDEYPNADDSFPWVPDTIIGHHGEELQSDEGVVGLVCSLINDVEDNDAEWRDIEASLGKLHLTSCFDMLPGLTDREGDPDWGLMQNNNEECCAGLASAMESFSDYFTDWIESLPSAKERKKEFQKLINPKEDLFLSFNYTLTLEELYQCKNVCHIHGKVGGKLIFGHAGPDEYPEKGSAPWGLEEALQSIYDGLRKDTKRIIKTHASFFETVARSRIDRIYSYGFSFSEIDKPYIMKICNELPTADMDWYIDAYSQGEERKWIINCIRACGFNGKIGIYQA